MVDGPVYLRDLFPFQEIKVVRMSEEERRRFIEGVNRRMKENGFDEENERTRQSEILTADDYNVRVY
jgi:ornithine cyclodeaminase/alanine dehydrogenase-like protein (mu-crystallin family)